MSGCDDSGFDAVERRLVGRPGRAVPPGHRDRVLAAVRDTLAGRGTPTPPPPGIDAGCRAALVAMALSAAFVIVAPWLAVTRSASLMPPQSLLVARARAAGIDLPELAIATTTGPPREPSARVNAGNVFNARQVEAWRMRTLLQGEL